VEDLRVDETGLWSAGSREAHNFQSECSATPLSTILLAFSFKNPRLVQSPLDFFQSLLFQTPHMVLGYILCFSRIVEDTSHASFPQLLHRGFAFSYRLSWDKLGEESGTDDGLGEGFESGNWSVGQEVEDRGGTVDEWGDRAERVDEIGSEERYIRDGLDGWGGRGVGFCVDGGDQNGREGPTEG
jgi:hypothetical protein